MSVRWGVLGAGWIVQQATAQAIHDAPRARLAAVASRDLERARRVNPERAYDQYQHVLDDDSVDAVYIALANDQHTPWIHRAIAAGKHVLCEKPLTLTLEDTQAAFQAADAAGVLLVEAAWSMWHPRMQRIAQLARTGALGPIQHFLGTFTFEGVPDGNYRLDPALGGGALLDIGVYPLHALVACLSDITQVRPEIERVTGGLGVDMTTKARLDLGADRHASIVASFAMPESQRLMVRGSSGQVRVPDDQAFTTWREATSLEVGETVETFAPTDAYRDMFEAVSGRILGRDDWLLAPERSLQVAQLVDALR
ncbi:MAG: Gfo/Idh/MocA family oxidoreductase [Actinomycetota bacterium]|nr:Gfo/Idh/MocA family oxidoreductase [Actinomycetota bacterium]